MVCGHHRSHCVDKVDGAHRAHGFHGANGTFEAHLVHRVYCLHRDSGSYVDHGVAWSMGPTGLMGCMPMRMLWFTGLLQLPFVVAGLIFCET